MLQNNQGERAILIIILIDTLPDITVEQIANVLDVSVSTIEKTIKDMRIHNIISREGSRKSGKWIIQTKEVED